MRYFLSLFLVCLLAFAALFDGPARAQMHTGYCDKVDSTAAALDCVNRHHKAAQDSLNVLFTEIVKKQDGGGAADFLNESQKRWIAYRDSQCAWDAALAENPSLRRVYELSCLTAMTESRGTLMEAVQNRKENPDPREFGSQPRWMNALTDDYPDIFWRYGGWKSADMNCDGQDERLMTGIAIASIQDVTIGKDSVSETVHNDVEVILAISENPAVGRPKAQIIRLPVGREKDGPHLCRPGIRMDVASPPENPAETMEAADNDVKSCKFLRVTDGLCKPLSISWNGKDYVLETDGAEGQSQ